jgi:hypothetical protein
MARKLMTFVPSLGFYNQAIAAPSMKAALEDAVFDHDRFGPEYDIAEHMPVRRFDGMADGEVRIAPVAPEDFVPRGDVPGLFFRVRGYDGHLAARPTKVG